MSTGIDGERQDLPEALLGDGHSKLLIVELATYCMHL
jgi:hypothetical protein